MNPEYVEAAKSCKEPIDLCDFPGCLTPALCTSGNIGGGFVCSEHMKITNGTCCRWDDKCAMEAAARNAMARRQLKI